MLFLAFHPSPLGRGAGGEGLWAGAPSPVRTGVRVGEGRGEGLRAGESLACDAKPRLREPGLPFSFFSAPQAQQRALFQETAAGVDPAGQ